MLVMWVKDLTQPDKPRVYMGRSGYDSVKEMQDELIRRRGNHCNNPDNQYIDFEVIDKIPNGVDVWRYSQAAQCWRLIQRVILEEV